MLPALAAATALAWLLRLGAAAPLALKASVAADSCSCSHCSSAIGRPESKQERDVVSLLTCRAQRITPDDPRAKTITRGDVVPPPHACGHDFCERSCKPVLPKNETHPVACRHRDHPGSRKLNFAQMRHAARLRMKCAPPGPCTCHCYCPEIVWPVKDPDGPAYPTPQPFFSALQGPGGAPALPEAPLALYQSGAGAKRAPVSQHAGQVLPALLQTQASTAQAHTWVSRQRHRSRKRGRQPRGRRLMPGWRNGRRSGLLARRALVGQRRMPFNMLPPPPMPPTPPPPTDWRPGWTCPEIAPCNCYCHCKNPTGEQTFWQGLHSSPDS